MAFHRIFAERKLPRDLLVRIARRHRCDDLLLPRRDLQRARTAVAGVNEQAANRCHEVAHACAADPVFTAHHLSYAAEQNLTVGVFGEHTARAKLERADDIRLLDALSDEDGADLRFDRGECAQHVSTMRARHRYIEQQDVWPQLLRQPERLGTAPRFSDNEKVGFPLEKAAEAFAMDAVV